MQYRLIEQITFWVCCLADYRNDAHGLIVQHSDYIEHSNWQLFNLSLNFKYKVTRVSGFSCCESLFFAWIFKSILITDILLNIKRAYGCHDSARRLCRVLKLKTVPRACERFLILHLFNIGGLCIFASSNWGY